METNDLLHMREPHPIAENANTYIKSVSIVFRSKLCRNKAKLQNSYQIRLVPIIFVPVSILKSHCHAFALYSQHGYVYIVMPLHCTSQHCYLYLMVEFILSVCSIVTCIWWWSSFCPYAVETPQGLHALASLLIYSLPTICKLDHLSTCSYNVFNSGNFFFLNIMQLAPISQSKSSFMSEYSAIISEGLYSMALNSNSPFFLCLNTSFVFTNY